MLYRQLPNASLRVSEIAFGSGGNAGLMVRGSAADQQRTVARALELGINYFDTAPDYGDGAAEANLGRAFNTLAAHPIITSKVEVRREHLDDIASHVVRSCESSLRRLQIERLDCLQIHNGPTLGNPELEGRSYRRLALRDFVGTRGALEGLGRLKAAGKISCAGFVCRAGDAEAIHALLRTQAVQLINLSYSMADAGAAATACQNGGIMEAARMHAIGCAVFSPLAGGVLSDDYLDHAALHPLARPHDPSSEKTQAAVAIARRVRFLAVENGLTLSQAAYRFILGHASVTTVIGGFSSVEQMEEITRVSGMGPFAPEDIARVDAVLHQANR